MTENETYVITKSKDGEPFKIENPKRPLREGRVQDLGDQIKLTKKLPVNAVFDLGGDYGPFKVVKPEGKVLDQYLNDTSGVQRVFLVPISSEEFNTATGPKFNRRNLPLTDDSRTILGIPLNNMSEG